MLLKLRKVFDAIIESIKGKKTIVGATTLLLWVLTYGIPSVRPDWVWAVMAGKWLAQFLDVIGMNLDSELLSAGASITFIGLLDKVRRMF